MARVIGQLIDARYKILRPLGSGGFGAVFEAEHVGTGRPCAVKVLVPDQASRKDAAARFLREARMSGQIDSEHVVQVIDTGRDSVTGVVFIAMELLVGEDLSQLLQREGTLERDVVLRIAAQALEGLSAAHEAGVVHRDLKPANLFLASGKGQKRVVKLLDFGIAKVLSKGDVVVEPNLTKTGGILGSPSYMSPEQAGGLKEIDHRTDIWSLGAVLYHLLSGLPPYADAETLREVIVRICNGPPPPLREMASFVARDVSDLVERAMAYDPAERFQTAREMLNAVEKLLADEATLTAQSVGEKAAKAVDRRRSRRTAALVGLTLLSLGIGGAAVFFLLPAKGPIPASGALTTSSALATATAGDAAPPAVSAPAEVEPKPETNVDPVPAATLSGSTPARRGNKPKPGGQPSSRAPTPPTKGRVGDPFGGVAQ